jgi:alcohol dehydrogenase class IV
MIVRWGLDELPAVLGELSVRDPPLISTERWRESAGSAMNAVCLPPALRYNGDVAAAEITRLGEAMDHGGAIARVSELGALAGPTRLCDYRVPREDLETLSEAIAARPPAKSNPRPAPAEAIRELLEEIW